MAESNPQALAMKFGAMAERRKQPRVQLPISLRVARGCEEADSQLVSMRDANVRGAFFYSDLEITVGETLCVQVAPEQAISRLNVNCEARVVRVEESGINGLNGVAVQFGGFEVDDPASREDDSTRPFIGWTVDMVEQMFARRPELETCASRIQGAA